MTTLAVVACCSIGAGAPQLPFQGPALAGPTVKRRAHRSKRAPTRLRQVSTTLPAASEPSCGYTDHSNRFTRSSAATLSVSIAIGSGQIVAVVDHGERITYVLYLLCTWNPAASVAVPDASSVTAGDGYQPMFVPSPACDGGSNTPSAPMRRAHNCAVDAVHCNQVKMAWPALLAATLTANEMSLS